MVGRKLIETALPLEAINRASERETDVRAGYPRMLHVWWSRKPLATARAVLLAALVDDPSARPDRFPSEADQDRERQRLFDLITSMVKWENIDDRQILNEARRTIRDSAVGPLPPFLDPFCGAASVLGLDASHAEFLRSALLEAARAAEAEPREHDEHGRRQVVDFLLVGPKCAEGQSAALGSSGPARTSPGSRAAESCRAMSEMKILDVVALTEDVTDRALRRGQVGTIVESLALDLFEIEFSDNEGRAYAMAPLRATQLMSLLFEPSEAKR